MKRRKNLTVKFMRMRSAGHDGAGHAGHAAVRAGPGAVPAGARRAGAQPGRVRGGPASACTARRSRAACHARYARCRHGAPRTGDPDCYIFVFAMLLLYKLLWSVCKLSKIN